MLIQNIYSLRGRRHLLSCVANIWPILIYPLQEYNKYIVIAISSRTHELFFSFYGFSISVLQPTLNFIKEIYSKIAVCLPYVSKTCFNCKRNAKQYILINEYISQNSQWVPFIRAALHFDSCYVTLCILIFNFNVILTLCIIPAECKCFIPQSIW